MIRGVLTKKSGFVTLLILVMIVGFPSRKLFYPRLKVEGYTLLTDDHRWQNPTFSPDNELIAFHQDNKIGVMLLGESEIQEWPVSGKVVFNVQWLSTSEILYALRIENPELPFGIVEFQFWVLDTNSGDSFLLNEQVFQSSSGHISLSPSRSKLAFTHYPDTKTELLVIEILYLEQNRLTTIERLFLNSKTCSSPVWGLDENKVVYSCDEQIWATDIHSNVSRVLGLLPHTQDFSLSPDGKWLILSNASVATAKPRPKFPGLLIVPFKNDEFIYEYAHSIPLSTIPVYNVSVSFKDHMVYGAGYVEWSSDSKHIVFDGSLRTPKDQEAGIWYLTFR